LLGGVSEIKNMFGVINSQTSSNPAISMKKEKNQIKTETIPNHVESGENNLI